MAEEMVNHPKHYNSHPSGVEAIDVIEWLPFNIGSALKYLWRDQHKGSQLEDLKKALWYLERELQRPVQLMGVIPYGTLYLFQKVYTQEPRELALGVFRFIGMALESTDEEDYRDVLYLARDELAGWIDVLKKEIADAASRATY